MSRAPSALTPPVSAHPPAAATCRVGSNSRKWGSPSLTSFGLVRLRRSRQVGVVLRPRRTLDSFAAHHSTAIDVITALQPRRNRRVRHRDDHQLSPVCAGHPRARSAPRCARRHALYRVDSARRPGIECDRPLPFRLLPNPPRRCRESTACRLERVGDAPRTRDARSPDVGVFWKAKRQMSENVSSLSQLVDTCGPSGSRCTISMRVPQGSVM